MKMSENSLDQSIMMDKKVFQIFRKDAADQEMSQKDVLIDMKSSHKSEQTNENEVYSLRELIDKKAKFCEDKIFQILENEDPENRFKYVHLKIKNIKERGKKSAYFGNEETIGFKTLIQIIDMSDKMLYNEVKAEQSFLTLINATVSHELRNPLASLIGQRD